MISILLIDDDIDGCVAIESVLRQAGHDVETANLAETALTILKERSFDVLIMDIIMPGMDGVEAIRHVRNISPDVKVIAISGGGNLGRENFKPEAIATTAYLQAAVEAGADWVLTKPFERADLVDTVSRLGSRH